MEENNVQNEPKKVEVNKDALERLLAKVDEQGKEIAKLTEIADKGRLAHWESTHQAESPKTYRLSTYDDKVILSWRMVTNQVWKDATEGRWKEKQEIEVSYADGSTQLLPYSEFITKTQKVSATLLSSTQKGGQVVFEVEAEGGQKYVIDSIYIN